MGSKYRLPSSEIKDIACGYGACIASKRITIDGCTVGYMYREEPDKVPDSGWRFFAGDETQAFADDASNVEMYDCNTIANYDPKIIPFLAMPPGSAYEKSESDQGFVFAT